MFCKFIGQHPFVKDTKKHKNKGYNKGISLIFKHETR